MPSKKGIVGVVAGVTLVSAICVNMVSDTIFCKESELNEDKGYLARILNTVKERVDVKDLKTKHKQLDFSSVNMLLTSIQGIEGLEDVGSLREFKLLVDGNSISIFESENRKLSVSVNDGVIGYCKFRGISRECARVVRERSSDSNYRLKEINNGFILEPSSVVV